MSWSDLFKQGLLVLQIEDPHLVDRVKDHRACLELCLGVQLVVVNVRLPCDHFLPNNGRIIVVRDGRVLYGRYCEDMDS